MKLFSKKGRTPAFEYVEYEGMGFLVTNRSLTTEEAELVFDVAKALGKRCASVGPLSDEARAYHEKTGLLGGEDK